MNLKDRFTRARDNYIINQVKKANIPHFNNKNIIRYKIVFKGRVQRVGFRMEVCELAKRLELTGYCKNQQDGTVLTEIQGPDEKIKYLIRFMESLKRIKIRDKYINQMELDKNEYSFIQVK